MKNTDRLFFQSSVSSGKVYFNNGGNEEDGGSSGNNDGGTSDRPTHDRTEEGGSGN